MMGLQLVSALAFCLALATSWLLPRLPPSLTSPARPQLASLSPPPHFRSKATAGGILPELPLGQ